MSNQISNTALQVESATELLSSQSIQEYMGDNGLVAVAKTIRVNENGYPFITMLTGSTPAVATNVYFGKEAAKTVTEGQIVDKAFFAKADLQIVHILNKATGLILPKFSRKGEGNYTNVANLF